MNPGNYVCFFLTLLTWYYRFINTWRDLLSSNASGTEFPFFIFYPPIRQIIVLAKKFNLFTTLRTYSFSDCGIQEVKFLRVQHAEVFYFISCLRQIPQAINDPRFRNGKGFTLLKVCEIYLERQYIPVILKYLTELLRIRQQNGLIPQLFPNCGRLPKLWCK